MLLKVKIFGYEIGYNTDNSTHSKIAAFHKILSLTGKVALMSFIGALKFYTKSKENDSKILNPFMIFYMKTLHGIGLKNKNVFFKY